jgi:hypothetical protein
MGAVSARGWPGLVIAAVLLVGCADGKGSRVATSPAGSTSSTCPGATGLAAATAFLTAVNAGDDAGARSCLFSSEVGMEAVAIRAGHYDPGTAGGDAGATVYRFIDPARPPAPNSDATELEVGITHADDGKYYVSSVGIAVSA